jgi:hypothetical protein
MIVLPGAQRMRAISSDPLVFVMEPEPPTVIYPKPPIVVRTEGGAMIIPTEPPGPVYAPTPHTITYAGEPVTFDAEELVLVYF